MTENKPAPLVGTDDSTQSDLVIKNYDEYDVDRLLTNQARKSIEIYNQGKGKISQNSSRKRLYIGKSKSKIVFKKSRSKITPMCLFHIIQFKTAKRQKLDANESAQFTVEQLRAACNNLVVSKTIRRHLNDLEDANLITIEEFGNTKVIELTQQKLGPVFEEVTADEPAITIDRFSSEETSVQFLVSSANGIKTTALRLFRNEVYAGMILVEMFLAQTLIYALMLQSGYPFVEGTIRQYVLTAVGLVGGLALIIGLGRQSMNSMRPSNL